MLKVHKFLWLTKYRLYRCDHMINNIGEIFLNVMDPFACLNLSSWLVAKLKSIGLTKPTEIQRKVIPFIVKEKKRDVFACSPTGSGKTLAYVIPILERLVKDPRPYFALIVAPTRELAYQINEVIKILTISIQVVKSLLIIGGGNYGVEDNNNVQGLWVGKPNIVVATPGRFLDQIINRNYLDLCGSMKSFRFDILVLDEADQLITSSFNEQLKGLLKWIDANGNDFNRRQTLLFSATLTSSLKYLQDIITGQNSKEPPLIVNLLPSMDKLVINLSTNTNLDQRYLLCPHAIKAAYLVECLLELNFKQMIIFCGTKKEARLIHKIILTLGFDEKGFNYNPVLLNSNLKQSLRFAAIEKFKSLKSRVLVTTELASRGLDIPLVDLIINYSCPQSAISYVHRVGRTCRQPNLNVNEYEDVQLNNDEENSKRKINIVSEKPNKKLKRKRYLGKAITFVTQYDIDLLKNIENFIGIQLEKEDLIDEDHLKTILKQVTFAIKEAEISIEQEDYQERQEKGIDINKQKKKFRRKKYDMNNKEKQEVT